MKKIIFLIIGVAAMVSCQQPKGKRADIENQIITYQQQVTKINSKIIALQQQLDALRLKDKKGAPAGRKFKVKTQTVRHEMFKHFFEASGNVQAVNEAFISPEVSGQVVKVLVVEGDKVEKGQLLAQLETDLIQNSINEVKTSLKLAQLTYKKQKELWHKHIGSEMQYLRAKTNKESLEDKLKSLQTRYEKSFIRSPLAGTVEAVNLKEGELAAPGARFIHIVNLDEMYINAQLSENYLPVIKKGDTAIIRFSAYPGLVMRKPIFRMGNVVNKQSRTFTIQFKVKNDEQKLKPNLLATLRLNDYTNPSAIVVPSVLIKEDIKGYYLYLSIRKNGIAMAQKRYVKIGTSSGNKTEVTEGLQLGDVYITDGYNNVSDGTNIDIQ